MENKHTTTLKRITSVLPILYLALIFFASLKSFIYYSFFGINVFDYLTLQEIAVSFFDEIALVIAFSLITTIFTPSIFPSPLQMLSEIRKKKKIVVPDISDVKGKQDSVVGLTKATRVYFILIFILVFIFVLVRFLLNKSDLFQLMTNTFSTIIIIAIILFVSRRIIEAKNFEPLEAYSPFLAIFVIVGLTFFLATFEIEDVKYKERYYGTVIEMDDKTITSDSDCYYIGRTKDFLFIHDERNLTNIIYPSYNVKRIVIPNQYKKEQTKGLLKNIKLK
nr:hypothetical protein [uncultured Draconibacterium sp.]